MSPVAKVLLLTLESPDVLCCCIKNNTSEKVLFHEETRLVNRGG
jgi:hypothetical protein